VQLSLWSQERAPGSPHEAPVPLERIYAVMGQLPSRTPWTWTASNRQSGTLVVKSTDISEEEFAAAVTAALAGEY